MWQSFKNYFFTAQLTAGLALAVKMAIWGWRNAAYGPSLTALLAAFMGFCLCIPTSALYAWWISAYVRKHPEFTRNTVRWPQTIGVALLCFVVLAVSAILLKQAA